MGCPSCSSSVRSMSKVGDLLVSSAWKDTTLSTGLGPAHANECLKLTVAVTVTVLILHCYCCHWRDCDCYPLCDCRFMVKTVCVLQLHAICHVVSGAQAKVPAPGHEIACMQRCRQPSHTSQHARCCHEQLLMHTYTAAVT